MKGQTLTRLVQTAELDYVRHFQELAKVSLELEKRGPDAHLLTTKAILEVDMGNFQAARATAQAALQRDPDLAEAHFIRGQASVLCAFVRADALPGGPGSREACFDAVPDLLREAAVAFGAAVRCNPQDEEAVEALAAITWALAEHPSEAALLRLLRQSSEA